MIVATKHMLGRRRGSSSSAGSGTGMEALPRDRPGYSQTLSDLPPAPPPT
jgi:hypothetical protein